MTGRGRSAVSLLVAALVAIAMVVLPAPASAEGNPPVVSNGSVTPTSLPYTGGSVTVSADVTSPDFTPLQDVWVVVTTGSHTEAEMALSADSGGTTWSGTVELGTNATHDPFTWHLAVHARDIDTQEGAADIGDVVVAAQPPDDAVPTLSDLSVAPRSVPADGGEVAIAVTATDVRGIDSAYADVTRGSATKRVSLVTASGGANRFAGIFRAPKNTVTSAAVYSVRVTAMNVRGYAATRTGGAVTVAGRRSGTLQVNRHSVRFGSSRVRVTKTQRVVITNRGASSTVPVSARLAVSGAAFSVVNAAGHSVRTLRLKGGATLSVLVVFRPRQPGAKSGSLVITRPDKRQKPMTVALSGRGVRAHS